MKKFILAAALMLTGLAQAQVIQLTTNNDRIIQDGDTYVTDELYTNAGGTDQEAKMKLLVQNLTEEDIYIKLKMIDLVNSVNHEEGFIQFCFGGFCYTQVDEGSTTPNILNDGKILAGATNNVNDYFANAYSGDTPGMPVEYHMALVQYAADGTEMDTLLEFTYIYDTTAGVNDLSTLINMGITVNNTIVTNTLEVNTTQNLSLALYNINGQLVKTLGMGTGVQQADLSGLAAGVYVAKFTTADNRAAQLKIVKK